jgi:hypothetical protein
MLGHTSILALFLVAAPLAVQDEKQPAPATATITADLGCLKCDLGTSKTCAAALLPDKKTPVVIAGKLAKDFEKYRCDKKVLTATGTLSRGADRQLVLTGDNGEFHTADNKKAPPKGAARVAGTPICGSCDLQVCDECTLAIANGKAPIILDGKFAKDHASDYRSIIATGRLYIDQRGLLRLDAARVEKTKKE